VNNVLNDWRDYKLSADVIQRFRLAPENYAHSLFVHPPVFVYFSAFLHKYCSLPLPFVPLIYQCGTMLLIPLLVSYSSNADCSRVKVVSVTLWAMLCFSFCPIAMFVSQKFWIDNCSMFTITLSAYIHLALTGVRGGIAQSLLLQFISGTAFSFFALQTKITALGVIPFLMLHSARRRYAQYKGSLSSPSYFIGVVCLWVSFLSGVVVGYAPWAYVYYVRIPAVTSIVLP
jgi:hypothetical protein